MSAKSSKKPSKVDLKPRPPRSMKEIETDYGRIIGQAGQCQYNIYVYTEDLKRLNEQLVSINHEAHLRKQQDEQEAANQPQPETTEVANES